MAEEQEEGRTYEEKIKYVAPIAVPLASKKSTKKIHKVVKKASKEKFVRRGVKEVSQRQPTLAFDFHSYLHVGPHPGPICLGYCPNLHPHPAHPLSAVLIDCAVTSRRVLVN